VSIRVAVVDDQALVRSGFAMILDNEEDITVVAEASTGIEAIEIAAAERPDILLMDIRMQAKTSPVYLASERGPGAGVRVSLCSTTAMRSNCRGRLRSSAPPALSS